MSTSETPEQQLDPEAGKSRVERLLPAVTWLRAYRPRDAGRDTAAGGVLAALLLPQALAYALLAELPPQVGLFAAVAPAVAYAALGTSRFVAVGPVALVALLTAESLGAAESSGLSGTATAVLLAAMVGALLVIGGLLGLARAADFVSKPVLDGFAAGVALLIASSQLRLLLGSEAARGSGFLDRLGGLLTSPVHGPTVVLGLACLSLFAGLPWVLRVSLGRLGAPKAWSSLAERLVPFAVLAAVVAATSIFGLKEKGVAVVGEIELSAPPLTLPVGPPRVLPELLPSAMTIALVVFVVGLATARTLAERGSEIDPGREMVALGAANLGASVTGGLPVGASVSRSSVARDAGAGSPLAVPLAGAAALGIGLAAAPLLQVLPRAAMAALVLAAVFGLVDPAEMRRTWRVQRRDGLILVSSFAAVLLLGVEKGLGLGILASLMAHLWNAARPEVVVLGPTDEGEARGARRSDVDHAYRSPVLVLRIDRTLFFGNSRWVRERVIEEILCREGGSCRCVLFDFRSVDSVDSTALGMLEELIEDLADAGLDAAFTELKEPVYVKLRTHLSGLLPDDRWFLAQDDALRELRQRYEESGHRSDGGLDP